MSVILQEIIHRNRMSHNLLFQKTGQGINHSPAWQKGNNSERFNHQRTSGSTYRQLVGDRRLLSYHQYITFSIRDVQTVGAQRDCVHLVVEHRQIRPRAIVTGVKNRTASSTKYLRCPTGGPEISLTSGKST